MREDISILRSSDIYCCVCFSDYDYLVNNEQNIMSLNDIFKKDFESNEIPDELIVKSCCNEHFICISCIRRIINNYENHPINANNSHFACPYPFKDCVTEIGFKNIFDHSLIKKICKSEEEWLNYSSYAERHAFPGYTIIKCPMSSTGFNGLRQHCDSDILIENELIKNTPIGELMIECTQNRFCLKRFCYNCKQSYSYYQTVCYECKAIDENENPHVYNYYFTKPKQQLPDPQGTETPETPETQEEPRRIFEENLQEIERLTQEIEQLGEALLRLEQGEQQELEQQELEQQVTEFNIEELEQEIERFQREIMYEQQEQQEQQDNQNNEDVLITIDIEIQDPTPPPIPPRRNTSNLDFKESSYLYQNYEITEEIAIEQILGVIADVNNYMICAVCKHSLYKTEKCNGMSHHNLERCYACGRIGYYLRGLPEHWNGDS